METVQRTQKTLVFVSAEVPAVCAQHAQVAIVTAKSWHLIAPWPYQAHGLSLSIGMPEVRCPVVDVSRVDHAAFRRVYAQHVVPYAGVTNLAELLHGLEALGAVVKTKRVAKKVQ